MVDTLISYHRGAHVQLVGGNIILRYTTDDTIGHSGENEQVKSGRNGPSSSGLTSICDPMVDTLISYHRGDHV